MKKIWKLFDGQPMTAILDPILQGSMTSGLAMVYILEMRMKSKLKSCYETQKSFLSAELGDTLNDFFVYLREGKRRSNIVRYEAIRRVKTPKSFAAWLVKTYQFFLMNLSVYEI